MDPREQVFSLSDKDNETLHPLLEERLLEALPTYSWQEFTSSIYRADISPGIRLMLVAGYDEPATLTITNRMSPDAPRDTVYEISNDAVTRAFERVRDDLAEQARKRLPVARLGAVIELRNLLAPDTYHGRS